jgi:probable F420-dependent oxidoreductase
MKLDAVLPPIELGQIPELAEETERMGFDALWSTETRHDPFLPLALIAEHTQRLQMGTAVAIGLARSPATLAYTSWDLARMSHGRFMLGLGTQVKAHIERRFGVPWPVSPIKKFRELIQATRSFWKTWQKGDRLNFRGEYFKLSLMTPFFAPEPIEFPEIPIFIAGVNKGLCRLAGELADGFHVHPYHSSNYLKNVILPAIEEGLTRSGRKRESVSISVTALVALNDTDREFVRSQIAFYASTPTYHPVMDLHGWGDVADRLRQLSRRGQWGEMIGLITEDMLETFATIAPQEELPEALKKRYTGLADRLTLYLPFIPGERDSLWQALIREVKGP